MDIFEPDTSHYYADTEKGQVDDEHVLHQHLYSLLDAGSAVGMVFDIAPRIETLLKRVGFVNIVVKIIKANIGTWGKGRREKEIGAWNQLRCEEGVSDWSLRRFTSELGCVLIPPYVAPSYTITDDMQMVRKRSHRSKCKPTKCLS